MISCCLLFPKTVVFLIEIFIFDENGGSLPSLTECENFLHLLDMSSKVYEMTF